MRPTFAGLLAVKKNKVMFFDGVDDSVKLQSEWDIESDTSFFLEFSLILLDYPQIVFQIFGRNHSSSADTVTINSTGRLQIITNSSFRFQTNAGSILDDGMPHLYRFEHDSSSGIASFYRDGLLQWASAVNMVGRFRIGYLGQRGSGAFWFLGSIYNVNLNNIHAYKGGGNSDSDWVDTIGSNDGVVNGAPAEIEVSN